MENHTIPVRGHAGTTVQESRGEFQGLGRRNTVIELPYDPHPIIWPQNVLSHFSSSGLASSSIRQTCHAMSLRSSVFLGLSPLGLILHFLPDRYYIICPVSLSSPKEKPHRAPSGAHRLRSSYREPSNTGLVALLNPSFAFSRL